MNRRDDRRPSGGPARQSRGAPTRRGPGGGRGDAGRGDGSRSGSGRPAAPRSGNGSDRRRSFSDSSGDRRGPTGARRGDDDRRSERPQSSGPPIDPARRAAFDALVAVESRDAYANLLVPKLLADRRITGRDAAFVTELVYGTLRMQGLLDAIINACSDRAEIEPRVRAVLRLGAYQLIFMRVPSHAAVDSTVSVARVVVSEGPAKFVNAVLRRISEDDEAGWRARVVPDPAAGQVASLAIGTSHPQWIVRAFHDRLRDWDEVAAALAADNERPIVALAARPGRITPTSLAADVGGELGQYSPLAVRLTGGGDPAGLAPVRQGAAQVQDEGSQLAALALLNAPVTGADTAWLDMCAGPGGKAALLGAFAAQRGAHVTAVEVTPHRADLVRQATAGMPVDVVTGDARDAELLPAASFDRILLDAPCTGLGALRRRPEARWRKQPSDIPPLTKLQRELLAAATRLVRPGGVIAYVTCSPHAAETRMVVADAVKRGGLQQLSVADALPDVPGISTTAQLWPHRHGTDAMFISLLTPATGDTAVES